MTENVRKAVLTRDEGCCVCCGNDDGLVIHQIVDGKIGGRDVPQNLVTLCFECHGILHGDSCEYDINANDVKNAIVQYMSEFYESHGYYWTPTWTKLVPMNEENREATFELFLFCMNDPNLWKELNGLLWT